MKVLLIDNYDSFVFNLVQYIGETGAETVTYRNDAITIEQIRHIAPTHIVLSPGPGNPENQKYFGICNDIISNFQKDIPILGVCLGHQGMAALVGAKIIVAPEILHGKTSLVEHDEKGIFQDIPSPTRVMRYHSLCIDPKTLSDNFIITAKTKDETIMAIRHKSFPLEGVQFHPESIGTEYGKKMIANFLRQ